MCIPLRLKGMCTSARWQCITSCLEQFGGTWAHRGQWCSSKVIRAISEFWYFIMYRHSSVADKITWQRDHFGKYLSNSTIWSNINKCHLKLNWAKKKKKKQPNFTLCSDGISVSELWDIWDQPSHSANVDCGKMNQYSRSLEDKDWKHHPDC